MNDDTPADVPSAPNPTPATRPAAPPPTLTQTSADPLGHLSCIDFAHAEKCKAEFEAKHAESRTAWRAKMRKGRKC